MQHTGAAQRQQFFRADAEGTAENIAMAESLEELLPEQPSLASAMLAKENNIASGLSNSPAGRICPSAVLANAPGKIFFTVAVCPKISRRSCGSNGFARQVSAPALSMRETFSTLAFPVMAIMRIFRVAASSLMRVHNRKPSISGNIRSSNTTSGEKGMNFSARFEPVLSYPDHETHTRIIKNIV